MTLKCEIKFQVDVSIYLNVLQAINCVHYANTGHLFTSFKQTQ